MLLPVRLTLLAVSMVKNYYDGVTTDGNTNGLAELPEFLNNRFAPSDLVI